MHGSKHNYIAAAIAIYIYYWYLPPYWLSDAVWFIHMQAPLHVYNGDISYTLGESLADPDLLYLIDCRADWTPDHVPHIKAQLEYD